MENSVNINRKKSQFWFSQCFYDRKFTVSGMSYEKNNSCSTNDTHVLKEHKNFSTNITV